MKKLQLKATVIGNKLQSFSITKSKKSRLNINPRPLNQNLSALKNKENKRKSPEEKQQLPTLNSICHKKSLSLIAKPDENKSKEYLGRKSVQRAQELQVLIKDVQTIENNSQTVRNKAQQLRRLLQQNNIIESRLTKICISLLNFQIILQNIITFIDKQKGKQSLTANVLIQGWLAKFKRQTTPEPKNPNQIKLNSKIYDIDINPYSLNRNSRELLSEIQSLKEDVKAMEGVKSELGKRIVEAQQNLKSIQRKKDQQYQQFKCLSRQAERLSMKIEQNTLILLKVEGQKKELQTFVHSQNNKIVAEASEYHRNIEIDMFEYEEYLRHHSLGRKDYQHSIYYPQYESMIAEQENRIDFLRPKKLEEGQTDELGSSLNRIKQNYSLMIDELHHAILEKTKFIKEFCRIVFSWKQNYLTKSQFLGNLKKSFCLQVTNIEKYRRKLFHDKQVQKCQNCGILSKELRKLFGVIDKIVELFQMGNSFY